MKKIYKWLTLLTSTSFLPIASLTSCSKEKEDIYNYTQEVIDEFIGNKSQGIKGITSCPRPGKYYDAIIPYLTSRAKEIAGLKDEDIHIDNAHNMYFDIPATNGYENSDMVILQGHKDMIVAGLEESEAITTPIDPVIDNKTIHSRDHKTSLGADDGAGVSIALTILKHRNDFNHGPLRFLLTADEDIGMVGAQAMNASWLKFNNKPIKWLINIDAEEEGYVYRSCAGYSAYSLSRSYWPNSNEEPNQYEYTLSIDGLIGGHSGIDITRNRANAERLAYEFLYFLTTYLFGSIQIVEHNHVHETEEGEIKDESYSSNQLISNCTVIFKSDLTIDQLQSAWEFMTYFWRQGAYSAENWDNIDDKSNIIPNEKPSSIFLPSTYSHDLINLFGNFDVDPSKQILESLYYGVFAYNEDHIPKASCNIGPISIKYEGEPNYIYHFKSGLSPRSSVGDQYSREQYSIYWLEANHNTILNKLGINWMPEAKCYPWVRDDNNELVKILVEGYQNLGVKPTIFDSLSGVEPAVWTKLSDGAITCSCVGPRIDGAHSINETLYIDTINPCVHNVIYAIGKIANNK